MTIKKHWLVGLAFVLSVTLTGVIGVRTGQKVLYWHSHKDEPIRAWMTVGYIAHSYHIPPYILYQALGLPYKPPDKRPISTIARAQKRTVNDVRDVLSNAIIHSRPPYPPPPPLPPDEGVSP